MPFLFSAEPFPVFVVFYRMKQWFLLLLCLYYGISFAQYEDRIDTTLLRQLGFRHVTICQVKPINQLNGTDECTVNMRVFFDDAGKLTEKHYVQNNEIGNRFLYRYNDLGQLIETKTLIYPNDSNSVDYKYDAAGNPIELQVYYRGAKTEKWCYTYNEQNQKTAEYRVSNSGDTITTYHYSFSGGKPDLEKYYTGKQLRFVYKYQYDQWGNETGKKFIKGDMQIPFPAARFSGPGKAVKHIYYQDEQLRIHSSKNVDWENNRIVREELIDSTGKLFHTTRFHYYNNGLIREILASGGKSENNLNEFYEYNSKGLLITKHSTFNGQENQRTDYTYDELGRCISSKRFYRGDLQESSNFQYNGKSLHPKSEENIHKVYQNDTLERQFEYIDTNRMATYIIHRTSAVPAFLFASSARRPGPEPLWKKPPVRHHHDLYSTDDLFWYDTLETPTKQVSNGDTIVTLKLGIFRWMMDESDPQMTTTIVRTEIRHNGIKRLTDCDSNGRVHLQVQRLQDGSFSIKRLDQFTNLNQPGLRKTYVVRQLYSPQLVSNAYYNSKGMVDSITTIGAQEITTFRYDAENRLTEKKVHYSSNFISTTLYAYNSEGQLVRETLFSTDGSISNDRHYTYEDKKLKQVTSSMPAPAQTYRFYYEK